MRIGELAKAGAVSTSLLRYYEEQGLLSPTTRTETGYRLYGSEAIGRLGFIQRAKSLGLTLREIRQLVQEPGDTTTDLARLRLSIAGKNSPEMPESNSPGQVFASVLSAPSGLSLGHETPPPDASRATDSSGRGC